LRRKRKEKRGKEKKKGNENKKGNGKQRRRKEMNYIFLEIIFCKLR
jgi:hypothetical protein